MLMPSCSPFGVDWLEDPVDAADPAAGFAAVLPVAAAVSAAASFSSLAGLGGADFSVVPLAAAGCATVAVSVTAIFADVVLLAAAACGVVPCDCARLGPARTNTNTTTVAKPGIHLSTAIRLDWIPARTMIPLVFLPFILCLTLFMFLPSSCQVESFSVSYHPGVLALRSIEQITVAICAPHHSNLVRVPMAAQYDFH
jgi:hypothetical protein